MTRTEIDKVATIFGQSVHEQCSQVYLENEFVRQFVPPSDVESFWEKVALAVALSDSSKQERQTIMTDETREQASQRIRERFAVIGEFTQATIEQVTAAVIVSGPAGIGKSYEVEAKLKEWDSTGTTYTISKGYVRPPGLLRLLWRHRDGGVLVFDDADYIFDNETSLNLLKAVCDTCEERWVSYLSERDLVDEDTAEMIAKRFEFKGGIIFLTNYDFDAMIDQGFKLSPHFQALVSRAHYIDLAMHGKRDYMIRIEQCIGDGLLDHLAPNEQTDVIEFINDYQDQLRELSLRIALKIGDCRQMRNVGDWRAMARVTCCKNIDPRIRAPKID